MSEHEHEHDPLDLEALDADSLLAALAAVEKAIPTLLLDVKPLLAQLVSPSSAPSANDEDKAIAARDAVEHYMNTLDKIQFVLRQTVFYLRGTRAAPRVLRPPSVDSIPRPLAATLREAGPNSTGEASLGLYGTRQEAAALRDMLEAAQALRKADKEKREKDKEGKEGEDKEDDTRMDVE